MLAIIHSNGLSYFLQQLTDEHIDETYNRLWKIIQHCPKNEYEYERLVDISKLWYYKNKCRCTYSNKNEKLIHLFDLTNE
jgi:hypothetical protein